MAMSSSSGGRSVAAFVDRCLSERPETPALRCVFEAVRALPYATNAAYDADGLLAVGSGDCAAAADLLAKSLVHLDARAQVARYLYRLGEVGPVPDGLPSPFDLHSVVALELDGRRVLLDPSHDPVLETGGLSIGTWDGGGTSTLCYVPQSRVWVVGQDDEAIASVLDHLFGSWDETAHRAGRRYQTRFNAWLQALAAGGADWMPTRTPWALSGEVRYLWRIILLLYDTYRLGGGVGCPQHAS